MHVLAEGDETDERVLWQVNQILEEGCRKLLELLRLHTRVNDEEEDGRILSLRVEDVFHGCTLGHDLCREVLRRYTRILVWKVVGLKTEGAHPHLAHEVDSAVGIEHGLATLAEDRGIIDLRHALDWIEGCVQAGDRHGHPLLVEAAGREYIPRKACPVLLLILHKMGHGLLQAGLSAEVMTYGVPEGRRRPCGCRNITV
eukprot:1172903-Amorphochlora_amoeboformis.AAC.1